MEAVAFAIGLDPVLTRGQQLVDQFLTWKENRAQAPQLREAFSSFETELTACIIRLQYEADKLPEQSRAVINRDIENLSAYLSSARDSLQSLNRRLSRCRALQFFRANTVAKDCEVVRARLQDARTLLSTADRHVDLRAAIESSKTGHAQPLVDSFRSSFPPQSAGVKAVLDFGSRDDKGNPCTAEGLTKKFLLEDSNSSPRIISILGIGGVGKSTVLKALSVRDDVRHLFPDGVHVMKLGSDATVVTLFHEICRVLVESGAEKIEESLRVRNDVNEALDHFARWFQTKSCAFLIDDVWAHGIGIEIFARLCNVGHEKNGNAVLLTTREHEVASLAPGDHIVRMMPGVTNEHRSREILRFHAEHTETEFVNDGVDEAIIAILEICAGLPVRIAAAGKNIKKLKIGMPGCEELVWQRYASNLAICRDALFRIDIPEYGNLYATFATSIAFLDEKPREETLGFSTMLSFKEMHRHLCVLLKQASVSADLLKRLWKTVSSAHAEMIARKFVEVGLASDEVGRDNVWRLSVHDSLHDFARLEADHHGETQRIHHELLESYTSSNAELSPSSGETTEWWSPLIEADEYIHRNVCRHLFEARRGAELISLLLTPAWLERQLTVCDILVLESDFALGVKAMKDEMMDRPFEGRAEERSEVENALQLISEAARLSSSFIARNHEELWFQIHGRLKALGGEFKSVQEYVDRIETEAPEEVVLCLNSFLGEAGGANREIISVGSEVRCMAIFSDRERVACGCEDGRIVVINLMRKKIEKDWEAHDGIVRAIAVGMGDSLIVSGSFDQKVKVWEVESGHCLKNFEGHTGIVMCVSIIEESREVVSGSDDGTAQVWDADTGVVSQVFRGHERSVECVAVVGDGKNIVTGGSDNKLRIWSPRTGTETGVPFEGHEHWVICVDVTPDGRHIVSGSFDNTLRVWDIESGENIGDPWEGHTSWVNCVSVSGDGNQIISGSDDNTIRVRDLNGNDICDPLEGHGSGVTGVAALANVNSIASSSADGTVRVWNLDRNKAGRVKNRHENAVSAVSFCPDGKFVVSGSDDEKIRMWNPTSGQAIGDPLEGHSSFVTDVAVTPNGQWAVSVSWDQRVLVWDLKSRELFRTFTGHTSYIWCVAITPDGDHAVTGSRDKSVRVWDLAAMDGSHFILEGHSATVGRVFVTDDGLRIVSVDFENNIFVWSLERREIIRRFRNEDAWKLSRREVLGIVEEATVHDETTLSIPLESREIWCGEGPHAKLLATMDSPVGAWALSPDQQTICVGLVDGQVGFLKWNR